MRAHGQPARPRQNLEPNYVLRRIVFASVAVLVVGAFVSVIASLGGSNDDANDLAVAAPGPTDTANAAGIAAAVTTPAPVEIPIHHGFQDDVLYVAIYGKVDTDKLGVLGEHDIPDAIEFVDDLSDTYRGFGRPVVPSFEIIASVASYEAGPDGDYSNESPIAQLQPWVDAADDAGVHVVLDLQTGREQFDSQVTEFEELLLDPNVSVALDPEWRVGPDDRPEGGRIGTVTGAEVNATIAYLDQLVEENGLPPKMLLVHQFDEGMITEKSDIAGTENVQVVLHMDGFGELVRKRGTYSRVTSDMPPGMLAGWKNFYDEDKPTPTPEETMDNVPVPMFVSFQ